MQRIDVDERRALLTFVVAGGGPTGVEYAGAVSELLRLVLGHDYPELTLADARIVLVEGTGRLLGQVHESLGRDALRALARRGPAGPNIEFCGWIEGDAKLALVRGASLFVLPSHQENFGLSVVEAMASGVPVLTSSTSALQEIAGGYAYLVDPMDVDAIARGIADLATDPARRSEFAELGRRRARDFSWDRAAERTLQIYAESLGSRRQPAEARASAGPAR